ncbi:NAD-dependent epimerase/dehydratase family protein [Gilvimarinus agarilyticus]|nr:NAD-dependent epimerase/dehydratase family protein [Gilvimarinus agarilyticus]
MAGLSVLVTGASGFIGRSLLQLISQSSGHRLIPASHSLAMHQGLTLAATDTIEMLSEKLKGVEVVVHCAGLAHIARPSPAQKKAFISVNAEFTEKLALACVKAGVAHFIFLSSIGVNGEGKCEPYTEKDSPSPRTPYAQSKYLAEQKLWQVAGNSELNITILRLPLVYGPNCKGNMNSLLKLTQARLPLPLAGIHNKRTLLDVDTLASIVLACLNNAKVYNQLYLVGSAEPVSTPDIMRSLAEGSKVSLTLFTLPSALLKAAAFVLGQQKKLSKLTSDLTVDSSKLHAALNFSSAASVSTRQSLIAYARHAQSPKGAD